MWLQPWGTLLRLLRLARLGYWSQQSRAHADSAKATKPPWDVWVSTQALILQENLCCSYFFVSVSTLSENFQEGFKAGSFSLWAPSKGSPAVCLSMRRISDMLQRTFFCIFVNPNCHPNPFLSLSSMTSFRARVFFLWSLSLSTHHFSISVEIISLFPWLHFIGSFCSCSWLLSVFIAFVL